MKIDNSRAKAWWTCPLLYWERYVNNIEPVGRAGDALSFGTRMHQLLELRHDAARDVEPKEYPPLDDQALEGEAQLTFAAYEAHYPEEPFEVVGVEEYFEVPLGVCTECAWGKYPEIIEPCEKHHGPMFQGAYGRHAYCGEFDAIVRMKDSGKLWLLETKTEKRGGKDNLPDAWQQKSQVGLYLWAAEKVYGEEFEGILLNVVTRQSPKGEIAPTFRRDTLHRSKAQREEAVRNIVWVADRIEEMGRTGFYPADRNQCVSPFGWKCDYYALHSTEERSEGLVKIKYKEAEQYLSGL